MKSDEKNKEYISFVPGFLTNKFNFFSGISRPEAFVVSVLFILLYVWGVIVFGSIGFMTYNFVQKKIDPCYQEIYGKGERWSIIKGDRVCMIDEEYSSLIDSFKQRIKTLEGADPETFEDIEGKDYGSSYFRDKNHVYYYSKILEGVNRENFKVIDAYCATDGEKYFKQGELLDFPCKALYEGADTSDWKSYKNERFGFEFLYPENMILTFRNEFDSNGTATMLIYGNELSEEVKVINLSSEAMKKNDYLAINVSNTDLNEKSSVDLIKKYLTSDVSGPGGGMVTTKEIESWEEEKALDGKTTLYFYTKKAKDNSGAKAIGVAWFFKGKLFNMQLNGKTNSQPGELYRDVARTFSGDKGFYGKAVVTGYPIIVDRKESRCLKDCENFRYVYFKITSTESEDLMKFIKESKGNSFVIDEGIGLGCVHHNHIDYYNDSDVAGMKQYTLYAKSSEGILGASENNPITIQLEKLPLTSGKGAPDCYSHITRTKVLNDEK